jgi:hypothetical protein
MEILPKALERDDSFLVGESSHSLQPLKVLTIKERIINITPLLILNLILIVFNIKQSYKLIFIKPNKNISYKPAIVFPFGYRIW